MLIGCTMRGHRLDFEGLTTTMSAKNQLSTAVVDSAGIWGSARVSTPEMKIAWSVPSIDQLSRAGERADVIFITTSERRGENLGFMILSSLRHADDVIIAARYYNAELLSAVKDRGALGAVKATSQPLDSLRESYTLLGIEQGSARIGPQDDQEREAIRLFKQGYPLLLIGGSVNKPSGWVINLLVREGLRKPVRA